MTALPRLGATTPSRDRFPDRAFRLGSGAVAIAVTLILGLLATLLVVASAETWGRFGLVSFVTGVVWDPVHVVYGALPFVAGTILSSAMAVALAAPVGILTAIYLAEWAPRRAAAPLTFVVELLAAVPSVVIGLWGVFVLGPALKVAVGGPLTAVLGGVPFLVGPAFSTGLWIAGVILAIMILPTIVTLTREVLAAVPATQREAMLALGATRWETVRVAVLPAARSGIVGAVILGLGRALGETMAVTMVIGNGQDLPRSLFDQANTIASKIATTFNEAEIGIQTSSLIALGLVLLVLSIGLNVVARLFVWRVTRRAA